MKIRNSDVDDILATVRQQLQDDKTLSVSLRTTIELLIALIQILAGRLGTDSANNSQPGRMRDYEADVLRFLDDPAIPFFQ